MKKIISYVLINLASLAFADSTINTNDVVKELSTMAVTDALTSVGSNNRVPSAPLPYLATAKPAFIYLRFAAAESNLARPGLVVPGLGIGYRHLAGNGAADISISGIGYAEKNNGRLLWTIPKASYLHYLDPEGKKSPYLGAGVAWGGIDLKDQNFVGIIGSLTAGYEFIRKSTVLGFVELNISQPAVPVYKSGLFPGPIGECTVGIGF